MTSRTLPLERIAELLNPYCSAPSDAVLEQLADYLEILLRWNTRVNLTSVRAPEEIVRRHFGESLFTAGRLPLCGTLLDYGSGAGFPGLPIQIALPRVQVTLAESQQKKASFLREVIRSLELSTELWAARVERMPAERTFDVVTLRAVDRPASALALARMRLGRGGVIAHLTTDADTSGAEVYGVPGSEHRVLRLYR